MTNKRQKLLSAISFRIVWAFILSAFIFACSEDDETTQSPKPVIVELEIGSGNNGIGVIGRDFHFDAEIEAGDKIDYVQVKIQQRSDETYSKVWSHEVTWDQYKGSKNAHVHKHFDIPEDAPEGKYDFIIVVKDENGTTLEQKESITLYLAENLPVDPALSIFNLFKNDNAFYQDGEFKNGDQTLAKNDVLFSQVTIGGVKGDGKMYVLLINKELNHRPESVNNIDFSKVIVYDVYEHENWTETDYFSNIVFDMTTFTTTRNAPELTVGAATDNNLPTGNPISDTNAWESGTYYFGVVYTNSTYEQNFYRYIELTINNN